MSQKRFNTFQLIHLKKKIYKRMYSMLNLRMHGVISNVSH